MDNNPEQSSSLANNQEESKQQASRTPNTTGPTRTSRIYKPYATSINHRHQRIQSGNNMI